MTYFPLFMDLRDKKVLVVGGGTIATRRIQALLAFQCRIMVVALTITEELRILREQNRIKVVVTDFLAFVKEGKQPDHVFILLAATDQASVNQAAAEYGRRLGALVNRADDRAGSDFYFPGIVKREPVVIGVTASGRNHRLAKQTTERIKELLNQIMEGQTYEDEA